MRGTFGTLKHLVKWRSPKSCFAVHGWDHRTELDFCMVLSHFTKLFFLQILILPFTRLVLQMWYPTIPKVLLTALHRILWLTRFGATPHQYRWPRSAGCRQSAVSRSPLGSPQELYHHSDQCWTYSVDRHHQDNQDITSKTRKLILVVYVINSVSRPSQTYSRFLFFWTTWEKPHCKSMLPAIGNPGGNVSKDPNAPQMYTEKCCTLGIYTCGRYFGRTIYGAFTLCQGGVAWQYSSITSQV